MFLENPIVLIVCVLLVMIVTIKAVSSFADACEETKNNIKRIATIDRFLIEGAVLNKEIKGDFRGFIVGKGSISQNEYYVAYQILEDGGKQLVKLDADKTIIYDNLDNETAPYVEYGKNKFGDIIAIKLSVPQETIVQEYNLALN